LIQGALEAQRSRPGAGTGQGAQGKHLKIRGKKQTHGREKTGGECHDSDHGGRLRPGDRSSEKKVRARQGKVLQEKGQKRGGGKEIAAQQSDVGVFIKRGGEKRKKKRLKKDVDRDHSKQTKEEKKEREKKTIVPTGGHAAKSPTKENTRC